MTESATPISLPIDIDQVRLQFGRAGRPDDAEFLYGEIANRMDERLKLIRLVPQTILDAGCGPGARTDMLRTRYPQAHLLSLDNNPEFLKRLRQTRGLDSLRTRLGRLRKSAVRHDTVQADLAETGLDAESMELLWSNLALHWHPRPHDVVREWGRLLKPDGLAFFSYFGPGTFEELRVAVEAANLQTATMPFVDMHDLGDMLVEHGFSDPVMDQEVLTLTYKDTRSLLRDVRALGGNANPHRHKALVSRQWLTRLEDALETQRDEQGLLRLTVEVSYGHAWRQAIRRHGGETRISLSSIGRRTSGS